MPGKARSTAFRDELSSRNRRVLAADPADAPERQRPRAAVAAQQRSHFPLRNWRRDGAPFRNQLDLAAVPAEGSGAHYLVATQFDAIERIQARGSRPSCTPQIPWANFVLPFSLTAAGAGRCAWQWHGAGAIAAKGGKGLGRRMGLDRYGGSVDPASTCMGTGGLPTPTGAYRTDRLGRRGWMQSMDLQMSLLRGSTLARRCLVAGRPSRQRHIQLRQQDRSLLSDRLAVLLLDLIARGHIAPGTRLPSERQMAEAARASRVCVRAALERLRKTGYVESTQGSGTRVVAWESQADHPLAELVKANVENLQDLAEMRGYLECWAAGRAAQGATPEQIATLDRLVQEGRAPALAEKLKAENDLHFHLTIARASGSCVYEHLMRLLHRTLQGYFLHVRHTLYSGPERDRALLDHHGAIQRAIANRDPEAARKWMHRHSLCVREAYRDRRNDLIQAPPGRHDALSLTADEILNLLGDARDTLLYDKVALAVLGLVVAGCLQPGDRLPSERELAHRMGVSRMSVRAGLAGLKEAGWIESAPRCGSRVAKHMGEMIKPYGLEGLIQASRENLADLCEIRGHLEVRAARRAAVMASPEQRSELARIVRMMRREDRDPSLFAHDDLRFHLAIARASGSAVYQFLMDALQDILAHYFEYARNELAPGPETDRNALEQHIAIQQAICDGDAEAAAAAMRLHSRYFLDAFRNRADRFDPPRWSTVA